MANSSPYYFAPQSTLPRALPTQTEIERSIEILCEQTGRKVVGVTTHFIVKYGVQADLHEGMTMLHIAAHTSVRVPKVYAFHQDPTDLKNYIVMERIEGSSLDGLWPLLSRVQKEAVSAKLKTAFDKLRCLPSPAAFCGVDQRPLPDNLFLKWDTTDAFSHDGPFASEEELNQALVRGYKSTFGLEGKVRFYERVFPSVFCGHSAVFTHGDFQRKNVMVRFGMQSAAEGANDEDVVVTVVDWETAGWYPSYWEYARALFACGRFEDDWDCRIDCILEPYMNEYAWMQTLMLELWS